MNTIEDLRNDLDQLFLLYPFLRSLQFTVEDEEGICSIENRYRPICSSLGYNALYPPNGTVFTDCTFIGKLDSEGEE